MVGSGLSRDRLRSLSLSLHPLLPSSPPCARLRLRHCCLRWRLRCPPASHGSRRTEGGHSASFWTGSVISSPVHRGRYVISSRVVAGMRSLALLMAPATPPPQLSRSDGAGVSLSRSGAACAVGGLMHPPTFWASPVHPAPVRVPSCPVPVRRFKTQGGGSPYRPLVVRGRASQFLPPPGAPSNSAGPLRPPAPPEAVVRGPCREPPLGARGVPARASDLPAHWPAASVCWVRGVPCPVCPAFPFPTLSLFFITYVSFSFPLAGLRWSRLTVGPSLPMQQGRATELVPLLAPIRVCSHPRHQ